jgi:molecular chaperone DnaK (HSP70)
VAASGNHFIGIDLGTTNSAIAFIKPGAAEEAGETGAVPKVQVQPVTQPVAEGRTEALRTLPSFLYLGETATAGAWAREQGALTPTKLVHSAKSWLSNPQVDRTAKILPWDAAEGGRLYSPVDASARYLTEMRQAWETANGPLGASPVVLTVPASFDEEARELTVEAAKLAGIENLTLLEEPAAAFYAWIANHFVESRKDLRDGMVVLVCDVGGGTSDFTLIRVGREGDKIEFTRTAVGKHLLLGGDNLDLTLSWLAEEKLKATLTARQRTALRRQCAAAKEKLLTAGGPERAEVIIQGAGRSLIGGTLRTEIARDEALDLALDGFLPFCELTDRPEQSADNPYGETGLPYVSDPAITKHLAAFLAEAGSIAPDAILFNGGFFIPQLLRDRLVEVVSKWFSREIKVLENRDLDLAVAVGAAYYSYVRSTGAGLVVRGGLPRAYYIGLDAGKAVTIVPRGTEDGSTLELDQQGLQLIANKPVSFRLYSSLNRLDDMQGAVVDVQDEFHRHAPLNAVIRFGKPGEARQVPVKLVAKLTEVGTLEIYAESKVSDNRWRLQFELRKAAEEAGLRPAAVVPDEAVDAAVELIRNTFKRGTLEPEALPAKLEQALSLGRASWPLSAIRRMGDVFLELEGQRKRGPAYEARWLNLCGLCLRPGFGFPGDDYRMEQARRIFAQGLAFSSSVQNESEWWIYWGRVAGGLNRNQQSDLYQRLAATLVPRKGQRGRVNSSLLREMWRAAASLELLPNSVRTELGDKLLQELRASDAPVESSLWCLSRLGARQLFYGPINQVLPATTAERWIAALRPIKVPHVSHLNETIAAIGRRTGDGSRDLPAAAMDTLRRALGGDEKALRVLEGGANDREFLTRAFGEELPSGLVAASE